MTSPPQKIGFPSTAPIHGGFCSRLQRVKRKDVISIEWFGRDKVMTNVAYAIHEDLVNQGVDPRTDYYYTEIDKRMRDNLPHKFQQDSSSEEPAKQQPVQTVASANRNRGTGRNVVKLSSSEAAIAKRLGLSNEQYASEKLKLQRR